MEEKNLPVKQDTKINENSDKESENIDLLSLLGIKIDDGKIEIDTNATKSFFESLQQKVESKASELENSIKEGKIDLKESVGVRVDDEKIEIDLNKTKSFLEEISNKAKTFIESLDSTISNITKKS
jgi:uncharacterized alkaline shock family protein YloU